MSSPFRLTYPFEWLIRTSVASLDPVTMDAVEVPGSIWIMVSASRKKPPGHTHNGFLLFMSIMMQSIFVFGKL